MIQSPPITPQQLSFAEAGFKIARQNLYLDSYRLWQLIDEGWRFVLDERGAIFAYLEPDLTHRLLALTGTNQNNRRKKVKR